ncbi:MAG: radical SAM protein [Thermodesulfobacteriota bacterium]|nr:radical SAM protein [Thermodesulfobacteriota bacterium]
MKLLLIAPASGKWQKVARTGFFNGKTFRFSLLSLLSVAAETPEDVDVEIIDEQINDIPWDAEADLVGITCMTALAPRAYTIAAHFMKRNIPVVLGGMHPTLSSQEAANHATSVVAGEAESVWPKVIEDARNGWLKKIYKNSSPHSLQGLKRIPRHLLDKKNYATVHAVQATRGCPHGCEFCAVSAFNNKTHRKRPVDEVVAEIREIPDRFIMLVDDNITADREYATDLFYALIPLKKHWVSQSTLSIADDPDFVRLAAEAGCIGLFVGLETFSEKNLTSVNKSCHRVEQYKEAIRLLHSHGIAVEAGIVFGFEGDTPDVFESTLGILDDLRVDVIQASIFTPIPGTPMFKKMKDRIIDFDWSKYDFHNAIFKPKEMFSEDLQAGHDWVTHQFYQPWRIARRLWRHTRRPRGLATLKYMAAVNMAYYGRVSRWNIRGWNPAKQKAGNPTRSAVIRPSLSLKTTGS